MENGSLAAQELLDRIAARNSFTAFATRALRPEGFFPAAHHRLLGQHLQNVYDGTTKRLMVFMPPGSAKSTYISKLFPAFWMQKGFQTVLGTSNTGELAVTLSREVQKYVRAEKNCLGFEPIRESAENWTTDNGCSYRAAGVGGTITGFRADLGIIDDPIKSRETAESKNERDKQWSWFLADFNSRLKPGAPIIIVQTRWHEDDLSGRLLEYKELGEWVVLSLPATALEDDPLGRAPGEMLWSDDAYGYGAEIAKRKLEHEQMGAMRDWGALYEQDPKPLEGGLFQTAKIRVLDEAPKCKRIVRAWDVAATEQVGTRNPDWTVGVKMGVMEDDRFVVLDVFRDRGGPQDVDAWLRGVAEQDGRVVKISLPQDPGAAGKSMGQYHVKLLAGFNVELSQETGNKVTRASPFASQVNANNVSIVRGTWNASYLEELRGFPSGAKDDQVDASSRAFTSLLTGGTSRVQKLGY